MGFGTHIKQLRLAKRLSAEKLARLLGVDADRLRKWEQKDLMPREADLAKIEAAFGMKMDAILKLKELPEFKKVPIPNKDIVKVSEGTDEEALQQKAIVKTLLHAVARVMSKTYNRKLDDCLDELEQTTILNLRALRDESS